jgi:hypothetical protein
MGLIVSESSWDALCSQWVDPAVRKQVHQLVLDHAKEQYEFVNQALNLLFERKPPIA